MMKTMVASSTNYISTLNTYIFKPDFCRQNRGEGLLMKLELYKRKNYIN